MLRFNPIPLLVAFALGACSASAHVSTAPAQSAHEAADANESNNNMYIPDWATDEATAGKTTTGSGRQTKTIENGGDAVYARRGGGSAPVAGGGNNELNGAAGMSDASGKFSRVEAQKGK